MRLHQKIIYLLGDGMADPSWLMWPSSVRTRRECPHGPTVAPACARYIFWRQGHPAYQKVMRPQKKKWRKVVPPDVLGELFLRAVTPASGGGPLLCKLYGQCPYTISVQTCVAAAGDYRGVAWVSRRSQRGRGRSVMSMRPPHL